MLPFASLVTDVDPASIASARQNVAQNALSEHIRVLHNPIPHRIVLHVVPDAEHFDFTVCNPPFFDDMAETTRTSKRACLATAGELTCEGGEVEFVGRLIRESAEMRERVKWCVIETMLACL